MNGPLRPRRGLLAMAPLVIGLACSQPPTTPSTPSTPSTILVRGCTNEVHTTCQLPREPSHLYLWVDSDPAALPPVTVDQRPVPVQPEAVDGGTRLRVSVTAEATAISLGQWRLPLVRRPLPPGLDPARALLRDGHPHQALERAEQALPHARGWPRAQWLQLARQAAHLAGDFPRATRYTERLLPLARSLAEVVMEADALASAAYYHLSAALDPAAARPWVDRLKALGPRAPQIDALAHYHAGLLAQRTGHTNGALEHFERAQSIAERLGMFAFLGGVLEQHALILSELGRSAEAVAQARRALSLSLESTPSCAETVRLYSNYGWGQLVLATAGHPHDPPRPWLMQALDLLAQCPDPWAHTNARLSLGLVELLDERPDHALGWLVGIDQVAPDLAPWVHEVRARAAIAAGRGDLVPSLLERVPPNTEHQIGWSMQVRQAQWARAWGFDAVAAAGFEAAEARLDAWLGQVGIDRGAELYLAGQAASARGLVEVRLDQGRPDDALCRARIARRRSLTRLDRVARLAAATGPQRRAWEASVSAVLTARHHLQAQQAALWTLPVPLADRRRTDLDQQARSINAQLDQAVRTLGVRRTPQTCDDLAPPRPDERLLMITELPEGWVVFVAGDDRPTEAVRLSEAELFDPAAHGLDSLKPHLTFAQRIRLIPSGRSTEIAFHTRRVGEHRLLELAPVEYSLDLPPRPPPDWAPIALVIADPSEDLPHARAESHQVTQRLRHAGWDVDTRLGSQATRPAVTTALEGVSLLHYAGHGRAEGVTGWGSALPLHHDQSLNITDLFALSAVPAGVVLMGCDTGHRSHETLEGGMNLGRAFALAGAAWVIAADVPVSDAVARQLGPMLYDQEATPPIDGAQALRRATLRLHDQGAPPGWDAFRVIVP